MTDEAILKIMKKTMAEMLLENNRRLMATIDISIDTRINKAIQASEERIRHEIVTSQENTIDTLSALIHTGYDLHEERIQRIENKLHLPPLKQN